MYHHRHCLFLFLFFICGKSFAQITDLNFRNYTISDGLPSNETYSILQDKNGYMWFSSDAGVCRFDGKKMTKYTTDNGLADNVVFRMTEDSKGRIWFNTFSGKVNYYYKGSIYGIGANEELVKITNHGTHFFRSMCIGENDTLYLGSGPSGGYYKIPPDNNYSTVIKKALPANTRFEIFSPLDKQFVYSHRFIKLGVGNSVISTMTKSFHFDSEISPCPAILLFVKYRNGYLFSNSDIYHTVDYIDEKGNHTTILNDLNKDLLSFFVDKQKNVWMGVGKEGVYFYKNGDLLSTPQKFLSGKTVCNIFQDSEGGMWFATTEKGIFYTANPYLKTITKLFLKDNQVEVFFTDSENNMLVGTSAGDLFKFSYSNDSLSYLSRHYDFPVRFITEKDKDHYYLGVHFSEQDKALKFKPHPIVDENNYPYNDIRDVYPYSKDVLLTTNVQGAFFLKPNGRRITQSIFHTGRQFKSIQIADKELLLACFNGLWRFKDRVHTMFLTAPELQGRINDLVQDREKGIWAATDKFGLIYIAPITKKIHQYTLKDGLPSNKVNAVIIDAKGNAWVATNSGIAEINSKTQKVKKYSTANGLLNDQVKKISCYNNELWMGTDVGICICDINELRLNDHPPQVVIANVSLNNQPIAVENSKAAFDHTQNNLLFSFDGLSFKKAEGCNFLYRLNGYEDTWHQSRNSNANYTNLSPGDYEFEVYAINNDGVPSLVPAKYNFTISPPLWKTWWFITLLITGWILFTYRLIKWRIKVFKKRLEEKNRISKQLTEYQLTAIQAQMNPHFIFNVITSIQNFILDKDTNEAYDYLAQFARLIRLILQHSTEHYISIEKELEMLKLYNSLEQLRLNKNFEFIIEISPEIDTFSETIPVMLVQPYIENAIWHGIMPLDKSKKGSIILAIDKQNNKLHISIEDNGVGRKQAGANKVKKDHKSLAMSLNQKRLELFNADMLITDKYDENDNATGTKVELFL